MIKTWSLRKKQAALDHANKHQQTQAEALGRHFTIESLKAPISQKTVHSKWKKKLDCQLHPPTSALSTRSVLKTNSQSAEESAENLEMVNNLTSQVGASEGTSKHERKGTLKTTTTTTTTTTTMVVEEKATGDPHKEAEEMASITDKEMAVKETAIERLVLKMIQSNKLMTIRFVTTIPVGILHTSGKSAANVKSKEPKIVVKPQ
jgi:hypothetical protein